MNSREQLLALATNGMASMLGIVVQGITDEHVIATMPVDARTHQPFGILHGGASIALAETVASIRAISRIDYEKFMAVGQEINGNHIRGKSSGVVTAVGKPVHLGRTSHVWSIERRDAAAQLICISRCTLAIVERRS